MSSHLLHLLILTDYYGETESDDTEDHKQKKRIHRKRKRHGMYLIYLSIHEICQNANCNRYTTFECSIPPLQDDTDYIKIYLCVYEKQSYLYFYFVH